MDAAPRTGAFRPGCAAQIPDRSTVTGTVDGYAQHAFPPKVSGRTTRPGAALDAWQCVAAGQNGRNFHDCARVPDLTSTPRSTNPACSYDMCAFGLCFSRVWPSRFVSRAWLAPFMRSLRGLRPRIAGGAPSNLNSPSSPWEMRGERCPQPSHWQSPNPQFPGPFPRFPISSWPGIGDSPGYDSRRDSRRESLIPDSAKIGNHGRFGRKSGNRGL
jgi:hypothetical protein